MIVKRCKGWTKNPPHTEPIYFVNGHWWSNALFVDETGKGFEFTDGACPACLEAMRAETEANKAQQKGVQA